MMEVKDLAMAILRKRIVEVRDILDKYPHLINESYKDTPLLVISILQGKDDATKELIKRGADLSSADPFGQTPMLVSLAKGKTIITNLLIEKGASVKDVDNKGISILMWTCKSNGRIKLLNTVLEDKSIDVNHQSNEGATALMWACGTQDRAMIQALVDAGADPKLKDNRGRDAYYWGDKKILLDITKNQKIGKFKDFLDL